MYEEEGSFSICVGVGGVRLSSGPETRTLMQGEAVRLAKHRLFSVEPLGGPVATLGVSAEPLRCRTARWTPTSTNPLLEAAREWLRQNAMEAPSLDQLSRHVGYSKFHLARQFRAAYGVPPMVYARVVRCARARGLVRLGVPLAHVAADCGYVDQSHLNREFKRLWGITPGQHARTRVRRGPTSRAALAYA